MQIGEHQHLSDSHKLESLTRLGAQITFSNIIDKSMISAKYSTQHDSL